MTRALPVLNRRPDWSRAQCAWGAVQPSCCRGEIVLLRDCCRACRYAALTSKYDEIAQNSTSAYAEVGAK